MVLTYQQNISHLNILEKHEITSQIRICNYAIMYRYIYVYIYICMYIYIYVHIYNYIIIQYIYIYYTNHWGWSIQRIDGGFGGFLQMDDASRLPTRVARST